MKNRLMQLVEQLNLFIVILAIVVVIVFSVQVLDATLTRNQQENIDSIGLFITDAIESSVQSEEAVLLYWGNALYRLSTIFVNTYAGQPITQDDIEAFCADYDLTSVALFKDTGEDIIIEKSTQSVEVSASTKGWGFWHTAFKQLFLHDRVTLDKGLAIDTFWMGPRSKSILQEGYYLFSYQRIPGTPYLLNLAIEDKMAFDVMRSNDPNLIFDKLASKTNGIDEIALIDVAAWNARFLEPDYSRSQDFSVLYGAYSSPSAEDVYYINAVNAGQIGDTQSYFPQTTFGEMPYSKQYRKISNNHVLVIKMNLRSIQEFKNEMLLSFGLGLALTGLLSFFVIQFISRRLSRMLDIERDRLQVAESYKHTVQMLPSMILRLKQTERGILILHAEGKEIGMIGLSPDDSGKAFVHERLPESYLTCARPYIDAAFLGHSGQFEYAHERRIFENRVEPVLKGRDSGADEVLIFATDITELRASENRARYLAYHDSLTGIPNRLFFREVLEEWLEEGVPVAMLFLDLDGFKDINDTAGHDVGDEVLKQVAGRLMQILSSDAFAARMGGDEFAIIRRMYGTREAYIRELESDQAFLSEPYDVEGVRYILTISIGVSFAPEDGKDYTTLLKKADIALYHVKNGGKNAIAGYDGHWVGVGAEAEEAEGV